MHIGIAGPISLRMLASHLSNPNEVPEGYSFPYIAALALALLGRGHTLSIFALDPGTETPVTFCGRNLTVYVGRYRQKHRARDFFAVERKDLTEFMRRSSCEVIHAHWTYEFALAAQKSGRPTLVTAHDAPLRILSLMPNIYRGVRTLMAAAAIRRASHLSAVSPYVSNHIRRFFRPRAPIAIVPNGISPDIFAIGQSRVQVERETRTTFATVLTGWGKLKNGIRAIEAFAAVRSRIPNSRMLMFGPGYGVGDSAHLWARSRGIDADITFVGNIPHDQLVDRLAKDADIFVHPSLEEAHPLSICEAMSLRMPIIAGVSSGGVPWTLEGGRVGILVDVRNSDAIAKAMVALVQDRAMSSTLSAEAWLSARKRFSMDVVAGQYEELYQEVLQR